MDQCACKAAICEYCLVNSVCHGMLNRLEGISSGIGYGKCPFCRKFDGISKDLWAKHVEQYAKTHPVKGRKNEVAI